MIKLTKKIINNGLVPHLSIGSPGPDLLAKRVFGELSGQFSSV
ncbi:MAG: hypothetical protein ACI9V1_000615 [Spirosomataceae bacterium]|jgi:hypothetical protein